jgi:PAS domain S-box-containing protein
MLGVPLQGGPSPSGSGMKRIHPCDRQRALQDAERVSRDGQPVENDLRFVTAHRGVRVFHSRAIAIRDESGGIIRVRGMSQDVTEQREAEQKLQEREALLADAEEIANFGSYQIDHAARKTILSPNLRKIYGFTADQELTPDDYWARVHPEDRPWAEEVVTKARSEGKAFDFVARFLHPEGGIRYLHHRGEPVFDNEGKLVRRVGVAQDVTERHEAEERLRERDSLLTNAEQVANFGFWLYDVATNKMAFSPQMRKIYGLDADAEWNDEACWERVHASDRQRVRSIMARAAKAGKPFEFVMRFIPPRGGTRYLHVRGAPLTDASGKIVRRAGVVQDITELVHAESDLRQLTQQLLRARDEERRQIARDLHESVGQSLAAIKMTLGRIRDALGESPGQVPALVRSAADLADGAVREVRTVSHLMHPPMLDEAGLGPALRWYARGFGERSGIDVAIDIPEGLPRQQQEIETTIFRIVQEALTNVHRYSGSRTARICVAVNNGDISAEVEDHGCGLPALARTESGGALLGVGIAGMRERVKQLNGEFEMESAPGKGTRVRVVLPTAQPSRQADALGPDSPARHHGA